MKQKLLKGCWMRILVLAVGKRQATKRNPRTKTKMRLQERTKTLMMTLILLTVTTGREVGTEDLQDSETTEEAQIIWEVGVTLTGKTEKTRRMREILKEAEVVVVAAWVPEDVVVMLVWLHDLGEAGVVLVEEAPATINQTSTVEVQGQERVLVKLTLGILLEQRNKRIRGCDTTKMLLIMQVTGETTSLLLKTGTMMNTQGLCLIPKCSLPVEHLPKLWASQSMVPVCLHLELLVLHLLQTTVCLTVSPSICHPCSKPE